MSSLVPLNNTVAQSSVDFNNQTPTNASGLFRYKVNQYTGNSHTLSVADLNAICVFSKDTTLQISSSNFSSPPPVGSEILFYSTSGHIRLTVLGSSLYSSVGVYTLGPNFIGKIIYKGVNEWFFASANYTTYAFAWENSCGVLGEQIYQIKSTSDANIFSTNQRSYTNSDATIPFNGVVYNDENAVYYSIANGYIVSSGGSDYQNNYSTSYTFYTGPDPDADAVLLYSVTALDKNNVSSLSGNKFFTSSVGVNYSCYTSTMVSPGVQSSYYSDTSNYPASPLIFLDGYIINIDSYL